MALMAWCCDAFQERMGASVDRTFRIFYSTGSRLVRAENAFGFRAGRKSPVAIRARRRFASFTARGAALIFPYSPGEPSCPTRFYVYYPYGPSRPLPTNF